MWCHSNDPESIEIVKLSHDGWTVKTIVDSDTTTSEDVTELWFKSDIPDMSGIHKFSLMMSSTADPEQTNQSSNPKTFDFDLLGYPILSSEEPILSNYSNPDTKETYILAEVPDASRTLFYTAMYYDINDPNPNPIPLSSTNMLDDDDENGILLISITENMYNKKYTVYFEASNLIYKTIGTAKTMIDLFKTPKIDKTIQISPGYLSSAISNGPSFVTFPNVSTIASFYVVGQDDMSKPIHSSTHTVPGVDYAVKWSMPAKELISSTDLHIVKIWFKSDHGESVVPWTITLNLNMMFDVTISRSGMVINYTDLPNINKDSYMYSNMSIVDTSSVDAMISLYMYNQYSGSMAEIPSVFKTIHTKFKTDTVVPISIPNKLNITNQQFNASFKSVLKFVLDDSYLTTSTGVKTIQYIGNDDDILEIPKGPKFALSDSSWIQLSQSNKISAPIIHYNDTDSEKATSFEILQYNYAENGDLTITESSITTQIIEPIQPLTISSLSFDASTLPQFAENTIKFDVVGKNASGLIDIFSVVNPGVELYSKPVLSDSPPTATIQYVFDSDQSIKKPKMTVSVAWTEPQKTGMLSYKPAEKIQYNIYGFYSIDGVPSDPVLTATTTNLNYDFLEPFTSTKELSFIVEYSNFIYSVKSNSSVGFLPVLPPFILATSVSQVNYSENSSMLVIDIDNDNSHAGGLNLAIMSLVYSLEIANSIIIPQSIVGKSVRFIIPDTIEGIVPFTLITKHSDGSTLQGSTLLSHDILPNVQPLSGISFVLTFVQNFKSQQISMDTSSLSQFTKNGPEKIFFMVDGNQTQLLYPFIINSSDVLAGKTYDFWAERTNGVYSRSISANSVETYGPPTMQPSIILQWDANSIIATVLSNEVKELRSIVTSEDFVIYSCVSPSSNDADWQIVDSIDFELLQNQAYGVVFKTPLIYKSSIDMDTTLYYRAKVKFANNFGDSDTYSEKSAILNAKELPDPTGVVAIPLSSRSFYVECNMPDRYITKINVWMDVEGVQQKINEYSVPGDNKVNRWFIDKSNLVQQSFNIYVEFIKDALSSRSDMVSVELFTKLEEISASDKSTTRQIQCDLTLETPLISTAIKDYKFDKVSIKIDPINESFDISSDKITSLGNVHTILFKTLTRNHQGNCTITATLSSSFKFFDGKETSDQIVTQQYSGSTFINWPVPKIGPGTIIKQIGSSKLAITPGSIPDDCTSSIYVTINNRGIIPTFTNGLFEVGIPHDIFASETTAKAHVVIYSFSPGSTIPESTCELIFPVIKNWSEYVQVVPNLSHTNKYIVTPDLQIKIPGTELTGSLTLMTSQLKLSGTIVELLGNFKDTYDIDTSQSTSLNINLNISDYNKSRSINLECKTSDDISLIYQIDDSNNQFRIVHGPVIEQIDGYSWRHSDSDEYLKNRFRIRSTGDFALYINDSQSIDTSRITSNIADYIQQIQLGLQQPINPTTGQPRPKLLTFTNVDSFQLISPIYTPDPTNPSQTIIKDKTELQLLYKTKLVGPKKISFDVDFTSVSFQTTKLTFDDVVLLAPPTFNDPTISVELVDSNGISTQTLNVKTTIFTFDGLMYDIINGISRPIPIDNPYRSPVYDICLVPGEPVTVGPGQNFIVDKISIPPPSNTGDVIITAKNDGFVTTKSYTPNWIQVIPRKLEIRNISTYTTPEKGVTVNWEQPKLKDGEVLSISIFENNIERLKFSHSLKGTQELPT